MSVCFHCKGRAFGAYLSDASGLDDFCPECNGTGKASFWLPGRGMVAHAGAAYDGTGGPIGTCDDPFCPCHAEHAATAGRDYLAAVDAIDARTVGHQCASCGALPWHRCAPDCGDRACGR